VLARQLALTTDETTKLEVGLVRMESVASQLRRQVQDGDTLLRKHAEDSGRRAAAMEHELDECRRRAAAELESATRAAEESRLAAEREASALREELARARSDHVAYKAQRETKDTEVALQMDALQRECSGAQGREQELAQAVAAAKSQLDLLSEQEAKAAADARDLRQQVAELSASLEGERRQQAMAAAEAERIRAIEHELDENRRLENVRVSRDARLRAFKMRHTFKMRHAALFLCAGAAQGSRKQCGDS
jgi:hypothetical protein